MISHLFFTPVDTGGFCCPVFKICVLVGGDVNALLYLSALLIETEKSYFVIFFFLVFNFEAELIAAHTMGTISLCNPGMTLGGKLFMVQQKQHRIPTVHE